MKMTEGDCRGLQNLLQCIEKKRQGPELIENGSFLVLSIERYMRDNKHGVQLGIKTTEDLPLDVIQITLTDDKEKVKVILDSKLNDLVQTNQLQAGSFVTVSDGVIHCDETSKFCSSYIIVKNITVAHTQLDWNDKDWSDLPWCRYLDRNQTDGPLTSHRGYFINVWSSAEMWGSVWKTNRTLQDDIGDRMGDVFLLEELHQKLCRYPAVLVKVLLKFRLYHYSKPNKDGKWPFQAQLLVGDKSGVCTMVFWNQMCPEWYYRLRVGDVLLIRKFVIKSRYQALPPKKLEKAAKTRNLFNFDLNINSDNPPAEIIQVNPESVRDELELPQVLYKFVSRREAGLLPENSIVDIAGMVIHVGRYEREPMNSKFGEDGGLFWIRQWLYLQDGSSKVPFVIQIYHATIGLAETEVKPGTLVLCTNTRIVHTQNRNQTSRLKRHICLTSTGETEVKHISDQTLEMLQEEPKVTALHKWSKSRPGQRVLQNCSLGGYCEGLPLPSNRLDVWELMQHSPPIPSDRWLDVFTSFKFREVRQLSLYAYLVSIKYHPGQKQSQTSAKKSRIDYTVDIDEMDSTENQVIVGVNHLDTAGSFPAVFTEDSWPILKQRLDFPSVDLQSSKFVDGGDVETREKPYFTFVWKGINEPTLLHSHLICHHSINKHLGITDILSGQQVEGDDLVEADHAEIQDLLNTGRQLRQQKIHVILDCYAYSRYAMEIVVKRAFRADRVN